jgi:hypothetical protein
MTRSLGQVMVACAVPLVIGIFVLCDDAARRRNPITAGSEQYLETLLRQERHLHAKDAHLEALAFDARVTALKRLKSEKKSQEAGRLAKEWLVEYYRRQLTELEANRAPIDRYLATLVNAEKGEVFVNAEFERLLVKPAEAAQQAFTRATAVTEQEALPLMLEFYERLYTQRMQRSQDWRASASN